MRLQLKLILLAMVFSPYLGEGRASCECGEHATGITTYTVLGDDCCTSPVDREGVGWFHEYENQGGVWKLVSTTELDAAQAQQKCCNLS